MAVDSYRLTYEKINSLSAVFKTPVVAIVENGQSIGNLDRFKTEVDIISVNKVNNIAGYTTTVPHELAVNDVVNISGFSNSEFNLANAIVTNVVSPTVFSIYLNGGDASENSTAAKLKTYQLYKFLLTSNEIEQSSQLSSLSRNSNVASMVLSTPIDMPVGSIFFLDTTDSDFTAGNRVVTVKTSTTEYSFDDVGADATASIPGGINYAPIIDTGVNRIDKVSSLITATIENDTHTRGFNVITYDVQSNQGANSNLPERPSFYGLRNGTSRYPAFLYAPVRQYDKNNYFLGFSFSGEFNFAYYDSVNNVQSMNFMQNAETPNNLSLSNLTYYNITVDDNAGQGAENSGENLASSNGSNAFSGSVYYRFLKTNGVQTAGTPTTQYDIPSGVGTTSGVRAIFWGVQNGNGRAVKVFITDNSTVRWIYGGVEKAKTFSELGISGFSFNGMTGQNNYSICDGINRCIFGTASSAWLLEFDWNNDSVVATSVTPFTFRVNSTEESSIQIELECVNGRPFWFTSFSSPTFSSRSITFTLGNTLEDAQGNDIFAPVTHAYSYTAADIGQGGTNIVGTQTGTSLFAGTDENNKVIFVDAEHDTSSTLFSYGGATQDTHQGRASSNIDRLGHV